MIALTVETIFAGIEQSAIRGDSCPCPSAPLRFRYELYCVVSFQDRAHLCGTSLAGIHHEAYFIDGYSEMLSRDLADCLRWEPGDFLAEFPIFIGNALGFQIIPI